MKKLLVTIIALSCTYVPAHALRIGYGPAGRIAKSEQPGKGTPGKCLPYAEALQASFKAAGIPARVVTYTYETARGEERGHAFVVYEDNGRVYAMDNESFAPRWLASGEVAKYPAQYLAERWSGPSAPSVLLCGYGRADLVDQMLKTQTRLLRAR
jgi:transglutaminase-like putative cysteine protease